MRQLRGQCGEPKKVRDRLKTRIWKHGPLWGIKVIINYRPVRVWCDQCPAVKVENSTHFFSIIYKLFAGAS
jgi:transposase